MTRFIGFVLTGTLCFTSAAGQATNYVLTPLGNGRAASGAGLNDYGQVAAFANSGLPFLWTPASANSSEGAFTWLAPETLPAGPYASLCLNNQGQVGLSRQIPLTTLDLWTPAQPNGMLGSILSLGQGTGNPCSINASGQVAGGVYFTGGANVHTIFLPSANNGSTGRFVSTGLPTGTNTRIYLSDNGAAAGSGGGYGTYSAASGYTPLAVPPLAGSLVVPAAVDASGRVFGVLCAATNNPSGLCDRLFSWTPPAAAVTVLSVPGAFSFTVEAMNNQGRVVGQMIRWNDGARVPFLFDGANLYDLSLVAPLQLADPSVPATAIDINESGQILVQLAGQTQLLLMTPGAPLTAGAADAVEVRFLQEGLANTRVVVSGPAGCRPGSYLLATGPLMVTPNTVCQAEVPMVQEVAPGVRARFQSWSDGVTANSRFFSVAPGAPATSFTARFTQEYNLQPFAHPIQGGTVTGGGWGAANASLSVLATPAAGYRFLNWTAFGNTLGVGPSYTQPSGNVQLYGATVVVAHFAPDSAIPPAYTAQTISANFFPTTARHGRPFNGRGDLIYTDGGFLRVWNSTGGLQRSLMTNGGSNLKASLNDSGIAAFLAGNELFRWDTSTSTFTRIAYARDSSPATPAPTINNYGQVGALVADPALGGAGATWPGVWTPDTPNGDTGRVTYFPTLDSSPLVINDHGQGIVYDSDTLVQPSAANGQSFTLVKLTAGDSAEQIRLRAINRSGVIVGLRGADRLFLWTPVTPNASTGAYQFLTLPPGYAAPDPLGIDSAGRITGSFVRPDGYTVPFVFDGTTFKDLSQLPGGFRGAGYALSERGQIVVSQSSVSFDVLTPPEPAPVLVPLTINSSPAGLRFTCAGTAYTTPATLFSLPGAPITIAFDATQTPDANTRRLFAAWTDGPNTATRVITTPGAAATYTANFNTVYRVQLSVNPANGGVVVTSPALDANGFPPAPGALTLTAFPGNNYRFTGFTGSLNNPAPTASFTPAAPSVIQANFSAVGSPLLSVELGNAVNTAAQPGPAVTAQLRIRNSGNGPAANVRLTALEARVLIPATGITATVGTALPLSLPASLAAGGVSADLPVVLNIPAAARRLVLQGNLTYTNEAGTPLTSTFSLVLLR